MNDVHGEPEHEVSHAALVGFLSRNPDMRSQLQLVAGKPAFVRRLDRQGGYILVPIRDRSGLRGIAQLDPQDLSLQSAQIIADPSSRFLLPEDQALAAARAALPNKRGWGKPFLGWQPCRESFDSMRPLWVVPHATGCAYVTQSSHVAESLTEGRGG